MNELRSERESIASDPSRIIDTTQVELELFRTAEFRSHVYDDLLPMISQLQSIRQDFAGSLAEDSQVETKVPELVTKIWDLEPEAWGGYCFPYEELIADPDEGRIVQASTDAGEGLSYATGGLHDAREQISKYLARLTRYQTERIVDGVHWPFDALINAKQETEIGSHASRVKTGRLLSDGVMGRWAFDKSQGGEPVWILATDIPSECPAEGEEPDIEGRTSGSEHGAAIDAILSPSISSTGPPVNTILDDEFDKDAFDPQGPFDAAAVTRLLRGDVPVGSTVTTYKMEEDPDRNKITAGRKDRKRARAFWNSLDQDIKRLESQQG